GFLVVIVIRRGRGGHAQLKPIGIILQTGNLATLFASQFAAGSAIADSPAAEDGRCALFVQRNSHSKPRKLRPKPRDRKEKKTRGGPGDANSGSRIGQVRPRDGRRSVAKPLTTIAHRLE